MAIGNMGTTEDKVILEYQLSSTSILSIWDAIHSASGLASWFADSVTTNGKIYSFQWGKTEIRSAELTNSRNNTYVRFHWLDEQPGTYFELRILKNDLTGQYTLQVTDSITDNDAAEIEHLWDTSAEALRRAGL